jgi:hypothetical protein
VFELIPRAVSLESDTILAPAAFFHCTAIIETGRVEGIVEANDITCALKFNAGCPPEAEATNVGRDALVACAASRELPL